MKDREKSTTMRWILAVPLVIMGAAVLLFLLLRQQAPAAEAVPSATPSAEPEATPAGYYTDAYELASANGITIQHVYLAYDNPRRAGEIREIRYLTIHETDNRSAGADAAAHSRFLNTDTTDVTSWHYTVDDHSIYQNLPDNEVAWNAGDQRTKAGGNINGIGIEMCVNLGGDYQKTLENTAALCAELLKEYGLTPDAVHLHSDFMEKICPHRMITEGRVYEFRELIRQDYNALMAAEETEEEGRQ